MTNNIEIYHIQNSKYSMRIKNTFTRYLEHTKTPDIDARKHKIVEDRLYHAFTVSCIVDGLDNIKVHLDLL